MATLQTALAVIGLLTYLELRLVRAARDAARTPPGEDRREGVRRASDRDPTVRRYEPPEEGPSDRN